MRSLRMGFLGRTPNRIVTTADQQDRPSWNRAVSFQMALLDVRALDKLRVGWKRAMYRSWRALAYIILGGKSSAFLLALAVGDGRGTRPRGGEGRALAAPSSRRLPSAAGSSPKAGRGNWIGREARESFGCEIRLLFDDVDANGD